jgi:hypothetical protein
MAGWAWGMMAAAGSGWQVMLVVAVEAGCGWQVVPAQHRPGCLSSSKLLPSFFPSQALPFCLFHPSFPSHAHYPPTSARSGTLCRHVPPWLWRRLFEMRCRTCLRPTRA